MRSRTSKTLSVLTLMILSTGPCMAARNMPSFSRKVLTEIDAVNEPTLARLQEKQQQKKQNGNQKPTANLIVYQPKDYSHLLGMPGFSDKALTQHFTLYQGYVNNTNLLMKTLAEMSSQGEQKTPAWSEIRRRLGWEFDGMRLHEMYFDNLGGTKPLDADSALAKHINEQWGSLDAWKQDFKDTGAMRGIGWAVLYQDPATGQLVNMWINEHDVGHMAGGTPLLIMDVFEHAYMTDYGLDRGQYIQAFFDNIDWQTVQNRYNQANPPQRSRS